MLRPVALPALLYVASYCVVPCPCVFLPWSRTVCGAWGVLYGNAGWRLSASVELCARSAREEAAEVECSKPRGLVERRPVRPG